MMQSRLAVMFVVALLATTACVRGVRIPASPSIVEFSVPAGRAEVFDASLRVAQKLNLNVAVLEKSSGLLKFENAELSALQLDRYANYPFQHPDGRPWATFLNNPVNSPAVGSVALNVLLSEMSPTTTGVSVRATFGSVFYSPNGPERFAVSSTSALEREFGRNLYAELGLDSFPEALSAPSAKVAPYFGSRAAASPPN